MILKIILVLLIIVAVKGNVIYVKTTQGVYSIAFDSNQLIDGSKKRITDLFKDFTNSDILKNAQKKLVPGATQDLEATKK